jgi:Na+-transporting methylmalonyl-CoA/oxaloacetate decarboxylase gamma subunit
VAPKEKTEPGIFSIPSLIVLSLFACFAIGTFISSAKRNEAEAAEAKRAASTVKPTKQAEEIAKVTRALSVRACTQKLLDAGFDVQCTWVEETRHLFITGPVVNRVFAHHFMSNRTMKSLRDAGFATLSFSNGKSGLSDDLFMQDYDLTP